MINPTSPIQALRVSKIISGRLVLREIDLQIAEGECVALMGNNGAGKTTLLRCLAALARPTTGEVRWFGQPAAASADLRRLIGMVGHQTGVYGHLTIRENLLFAARMSAVDQPVRKVDAMLEQVDLRTAADQHVHQVSRGTRQRLALARALIHEPQIVLLDEPFSGLDPSSRNWLVHQMHDLQSRGCAVCFATHDQRLAEQLGDRTLALHEGTVLEAPLASDPSIENVLLRNAG